ncbi:uncharacterized protein PV06_00287 [Exophiala oligosperma]|uniref:Uncharacterized protein n=1 Tax=Exophiala oligosperma TaxID=215243 RepID=A0A0D2EI25_9EURO|nr:uncharacterized protein PV06_00287 [Exophiala oligosperma]KIW47604.1 hypothetical protein PV06_00287 [Exophiala oligosperma]
MIHYPSKGPVGCVITSLMLRGHGSPSTSPKPITRFFLERALIASHPVRTLFGRVRFDPKALRLYNGIPAKVSSGQPNSANMPRHVCPRLFRLGPLNGQFRHSCDFKPRSDVLTIRAVKYARCAGNCAELLVGC